MLYSYHDFPREMSGAYTSSGLYPLVVGANGSDVSCTSPLAAATHLLQCPAAYQTWYPQAHRHSNATALQCIHCVRAVHHEVVILFVGRLLSHRTHLCRPLTSQCPVLSHRKHLSNFNLHACANIVVLMPADSVFRICLPV